MDYLSFIIFKSMYYHRKIKQSFNTNVGIEIK